MYTWSFLCLISAALGQGGLIINPDNDDRKLAGNATISLPIDISSLFNNRAFAKFPGDADYDGLDSGYPADFLPPENLTYAGVDFRFPQYIVNGSDNLLAEGQTVSVQEGRYFSAHLFAAAESSVATGTVNATYVDNSTSSSAILVDPWWSWPYPYGGDLVFPYYLSNTGVDYNRSMIFHSIVRLDPTKNLTSIQLPEVTSGSSTEPGGAAEGARLHVFALSLVPATGSGVSLAVADVRTTNMWIEGKNKVQIVEATINNIGDSWILACHDVKLNVYGPGLVTVEPGHIHRLRPGDQARVQVGVINTNGTLTGTNGLAELEVSGRYIDMTSTFNATYGVPAYEATFESIYSHSSPPWYNNAKFGIFIHWGVYAVPGWGNSGENEAYAEWYWWYMNQGPGTSVGAYEYNLATYGPDHVYDDFFQNFTASAFDPKAWVDLFADAGAQYFVQVTKHHDGYALFDIPENVTKRTSVAQYPHRNLLQELFDAAAEHQPTMHRGTYFSLPEWFHPDYKPYGFGDWPGGNATNPYTNATLPYTGYVPVNDFVSDLILPEMLTLASMGTEIMWCDIGGPNLTAQFAAEFFNSNAVKGKQVVMNNRCGLPGDFDTPEYARYKSVQTRKWESNLGMDPYSYGYNRATPTASYLTPAGIVTSLVDIVAKNGNFLLDIGPMADGRILEIEQENLRGAGRWINSHAEAIFNTTYWFVTPEEGEAVRFTQTLDAFYILTLYAPNSTLLIESPVPYVAGDAVTVVGGGQAGTVVPSELLSNGSLLLSIDQALVAADEFSWVFKISFT